MTLGAGQVAFGAGQMTQKGVPVVPTCSHFMGCCFIFWIHFRELRGVREVVREWVALGQIARRCAHCHW